MNRRVLLMATTALPLLAAGCGREQSISSPLAYTREVYEQALASGEPFMLDFYAEW